jgi:hypothetical protein
MFDSFKPAAVHTRLWLALTVIALIGLVGILLLVRVSG